jgi:hypothetical protein
VAATLTGFIGVVFVFGERSHRLGREQYSALFHLMYSSLSALFISLFAALMLVYLGQQDNRVVIHAELDTIPSTCVACGRWHRMTPLQAALRRLYS